MVSLIPILDPLQSTLNPVVRVILPKHKSNHINPLLKTHVGLPRSITVKSETYDFQGLIWLAPSSASTTNQLTHSVLATLTFMSLYKHPEHVSTSTSLLTTPSFRSALPPNIHMVCSLTSFRSLPNITITERISCVSFYKYELPPTHSTTPIRSTPNIPFPYLFFSIVQTTTLYILIVLCFHSCLSYYTLSSMRSAMSILFILHA